MIYKRGEAKMIKFKNALKKFWNDESAQGLTEYVLLAVVIVGIVMAFKEPIKKAMNDQISNLTGKINEVGSGN
jgi:Flp pilus assembly pilin Flp